MNQDVILHSAEEKGSLLAHAGEGQGFCQKIQVTATVWEELTLKYHLYSKEIRGVIIYSWLALLEKWME